LTFPEEDSTPTRKESLILSPKRGFIDIRKGWTGSRLAVDTDVISIRETVRRHPT
jgi:hypothetical protein